MERPREEEARIVVLPGRSPPRPLVSAGDWGGGAAPPRPFLAPISCGPNVSPASLIREEGGVLEEKRGGQKAERVGARERPGSGPASRRRAGVTRVPGPGQLSALSAWT